MSRQVLQMRPRDFSRNMLSLADAFAPLVERMVNDKNIVFARPQALENDVCVSPDSAHLPGLQKGGKPGQKSVRNKDVTD